MAEHFVGPAKLFEAGVSGLRTSAGELAGGYWLVWSQIYDTEPAASTAVGLCEDAEGKFLHPNPVQLGPRGNIIAYGLGLFRLKIYATLEAIADDDYGFLFFVQLGVVRDI